MSGKEKFTLEQVAEALVRARGNKEKAARQLGCARQTVMDYCRRHPELRDVSRLARVRQIERAEEQLAELVKAGQWPAIRFVLEVLGRDRGYVRRRPMQVFTAHERPTYAEEARQGLASARAVYGDDQSALTGRDAIPLKKGHKPYWFTSSEVVDALWRAHGIRRHAAALLGCAPSTLYRYIARYPEVAEAAEWAREELVDEAETQAMAKVDTGYLPTIKFVLDTIGRVRGWGGGLTRSPDAEAEAWDRELEELEEQIRRASERLDAREAETRGSSLGRHGDTERGRGRA